MYRQSQNNMNGSFFDRIGVADMEKVHSAVIGWIFSDDCNALTNQQKSDLLSCLFQVYWQYSWMVEYLMTALMPLTLQIVMDLLLFSTLMDLVEIWCCQGLIIVLLLSRIIQRYCLHIHLKEDISTTICSLIPHLVVITLMCLVLQERLKIQVSTYYYKRNPRNKSWGSFYIFSFFIS